MVSDWKLDPDIDNILNYKNFESRYSDQITPVDECPVCASAEMEQLCKQLIRCRASTLFEVDSYLQVCGKCGTIMVDQVYPPEYYFEYLNNFYDVIPDSYPPKAFAKPALKIAFLNNTMCNFGMKPKTILEVSSYDGAFVEFLRSEYDAEVWGVEPTTGAVDLANKTYPWLASNTINKVFEECSSDLEGKTFDFIVFSSAFRQNAWPLKAMEIVDQCIAPGGYVLVDEGNFLENLIWCPVVEVGYNLFQQKNFYYSINSLSYLFERYGFEYVAHVGHHEMTNAGSMPYIRRLEAVLFRRNTDIQPDEERLWKSKMTSDNVVEVFKKNFKNKDDIIHAITTGG